MITNKPSDAKNAFATLCVIIVIVGIIGGAGFGLYKVNYNAGLEAGRSEGYERGMTEGKEATEGKLLDPKDGVAYRVELCLLDRTAGVYYSGDGLTSDVKENDDVVKNGGFWAIVR